MLRAVALGLAGLGALAFATLCGVVPPVLAGGGDKAVAIPPSTTDVSPAPGNQVAILAGGCFWGMEAVFEQVKGVKSVTSGYAGGTRATATYAQVVTERTGHAEAIRIVYDPVTVSFGQLLKVFFAVAHDPTQKNRQGADVGSQYRSAIFPLDDAQRAVARADIDQLQAAGTFAAPIATTIEPMPDFHVAEAYHHDYAAKNPGQPYIRAVSAPKVEKLEKAFPDRLK